MVLEDTVSLKTIKQKKIPVSSFKINLQRPLYCEISSTWLNYTKERQHIWSLSKCAIALGDVTYC